MNTNTKLFNKIEAIVSLKEHQEAFRSCYSKHIDFTPSIGDEYFTVEINSGIDHFGETIWNEGIITDSKACATDYATLFWGGSQVRFTRIERNAPNAGEIKKTALFDVPEWK